MAVELITRRRFTVDEYHRMVEAGILQADDRVELIRGEIVHMSPIGPPHAGCVAALIALFVRRLGERAVVWPQNPVAIFPDSEPQPDVVLLRYRPDYYRNAHPEPGAVLLLVEVADSSLPYDRRVKLPLYADSGIPEVWIVDVEGSAIEVFRGPEAGGYRDFRRIGRGQRIAPHAFPDVTLTIADILG